MLAAATEYTKKHRPQLTAFQQDLPASESFRECISNTLSALKFKIKFINWILPDSCITTANLYN